jgi:catechol 2,3-dioxygenase-like lactoylglutathione lyase family enzyme
MLARSTAIEELPMADDQKPQQRVMPTLRITDYARSKDFYVEGLGFQVDWEHRFEPGLPVFVQVSREGLAFFLTEHTGDCPVGGLVHLYIADVDDWYSEFQRKGVAVHEPPDEYLQGLRSMTVVDPDGNKLHICTRLAEWRR